MVVADPEWRTAKMLSPAEAEIEQIIATLQETADYFVWLTNGDNNQNKRFDKDEIQEIHNRITYLEERIYFLKVKLNGIKV
jgi:hypothetical protein